MNIFIRVNSISFLKKKQIFSHSFVRAKIVISKSEDNCYNCIFYRGILAWAVFKLIIETSLSEIKVNYLMGFKFWCLLHGENWSKEVSVIVLFFILIKLIIDIQFSFGLEKNEISWILKYLIFISHFLL